MKNIQKKSFKVVIDYLGIKRPFCYT